MSVIALTVLPTLGNIFIDYRYRKQQLNIDKPPATKVISDVFVQYIPSGELTITNLDAWAAWYHGLSTMWFPVSPDMLKGFENKVKYIAITNYKENDADFALGDWRGLLDEPAIVENQFIKENYHLIETINIKAEQTYENQIIKGVIYKRNDQVN